MKHLAAWLQLGGSIRLGSFSRFETLQSPFLNGGVELGAYNIKMDRSLSPARRSDMAQPRPNSSTNSASLFVTKDLELAIESCRREVALISRSCRARNVKYRYKQRFSLLFSTFIQYCFQGPEIRSRVRHLSLCQWLQAGRRPNGRETRCSTGHRDLR